MVGPAFQGWTLPQSMEALVWVPVEGALSGTREWGRGTRRLCGCRRIARSESGSVLQTGESVPG